MMNYPVWDVPIIGGGLIIAVIAITHVFVAQFAVGGGAFLVWTEMKAYRDNDAEMLEFIRRSSRFFILTTLVFGAVSGVGIWFAIGLVSPSATSSLIHIFVWGWAIEWVFFILEIAAAFVYYYQWDRLSRRVHVIVGWIYFAAAWLSLAVINGILSFMLTPGRWLEDHQFLSGVLNPTYFPSLLLRTCVSLALAGLWAMVACCFVQPAEARARMVKYAASWLAPPFLLMPFLAIWFVSMLPELSKVMIQGGAAAVSIFFALSIVFSLIIFLFTFAGPYRRPHEFPLAFALMIFIMGFMVTGVSEWLREAVRKPYLIYDYMYVNSIHPDEVAELRRNGILRSAKWALVDRVNPAGELFAGHEVFRVQCQSCHTIDGYNGVRVLVRGWNEGYIDSQLAHLNTLKGYMPPFAGTPEERRALAQWLATLNRT